MYKLYICTGRYELMSKNPELSEIIQDLSYAYYEVENAMYLITQRLDGGDEVFCFIRTEEDYLDLIDKYNNKLL